jgi:hypothetical protein
MIRFGRYAALLAAAVMLLGVLAGCTGVTRVASQESRSVLAGLHPDLTKHQLKVLNYVVRYPRPDQTASVSLARVKHMADWSRNQYPGARSAQFLLRRVTDTAYGPVHHHHVAPIIDKRLVWLIVVPDNRICICSGPVGFDSGVSYRSGTAVALIDAVTGENLGGQDFTYAHPN